MIVYKNPKPNSGVIYWINKENRYFYKYPNSEWKEFDINEDIKHSKKIIQALKTGWIKLSPKEIENFKVEML